jgi:hypothetical protein
MPANFDTQREFTLVARAPSSANLRPNHEFVADGLSSAHGSVRATLFTRWENIGQEAPAPRELVIELVGAAPDLDAAHQAFLPIARFLGTLTAFATNVQVGFVETHLVLETTPGAVEHEMLEVFLPDERGLVREGRMVRPEHLAALGPALGHPEWPRLARAIAHYELALRDWRLGGEALALSQLFIAAENLSRAVWRHHCRTTDTAEESLAESVGIVPNDPSRPRWRELLDQHYRREAVFAGDQEVHQSASQASNGIEHGSMEFSEVHRRATLATLKTFRYVRRSILHLLDLDPGVREEMAAIEPRDVLSLRKGVRGYFVGDPPLEASGERYLLVRWESSIGRLRWVDDRLNADFKERMTVVTADGVGFRAEGFFVLGREEEGRAFQFDSDSVRLLGDAEE